MIKSINKRFMVRELKSTPSTEIKNRTVINAGFVNTVRTTEVEVKKEIEEKVEEVELKEVEVKHSEIKQPETKKTETKQVEQKSQKKQKQTNTYNNREEK